MNKNETQKEYWGSLNDLTHFPSSMDAATQEFTAPPADKEAITEMERRTFLKLMGASLLMTAATSCRKPVEKIIPYVNKPEEITPGVANWYASTCGECSGGCGTLVKTREGRPIKIEGNTAHPSNRGGLCARGQYSVYNLYDPDRLKTPVQLSGGTWSEVAFKDTDRAIATALSSSRKVALLTGLVTGPASKKLIEEFNARFNALHVSYDPSVPEEIALAHEASYGKRLIPHYRLDKAQVVVSFGADFLGTWLSPVEFARDFANARKPDAGKMLRFIAIEPALTLTGSNADDYFAVAPGAELDVALALANEIINENKVGVGPAILKNYDLHTVCQNNGLDAAKLKEVAKLLADNRGQSLVLGGPLKGKNAVWLQSVVNMINSALGNDGMTINASAALPESASSFEAVAQLIDQMNRGEIDVLVTSGINPAFILPSSLNFAEAVKKVRMVVAVSDRVDESAKLAHYVLPLSHSLESWGDRTAHAGLVSIVQPTIRPLYDSRTLEENLLSWMGDNRSWHDYLVQTWESSILSGGSWTSALQAGFVVTRESDGISSSGSFNTAALNSITPSSSTSELGLTLYTSVPLLDGRVGNNAPMFELPEPISKVTWENFVSISPALAREKNLKEGDVALIKTETFEGELTVLVQPKMHGRSLMAAVGYGRTAAGEVGNGVGVNTFPFQKVNGKTVEWSLPVTDFSRTGKINRLALTQIHHTVSGRPILNDATFAEFQKDPHAGQGHHHATPSMWPVHEYKGYRWGMAIDMTSCIGCNSCMAACQVENNVAVVGKTEVIRGRDMHWLRIDRYYKGDENNPVVAFQPMLCQHCENAPCETVCPVVATTHNDEGLNTQIYNRCVGTRYCANNCPYKVRRFNYFDYMESLRSPLNLGLNPDISVRSQGVMEKCTFCMHRIREAKDHAKDENRLVRDGEVITACQQTCPTNAIIFGNINDPESAVSKAKKSQRGYHVLEELNAKPQVTYLTKIRNTVSQVEGEHKGHGE